ncbi:hypothetical protein MAR621_02992 [Maribacter dokdonensis]|nr:hypothetical protein MAR621_02992 [Maribacter dokdonensis]
MALRRYFVQMEWDRNPVIEIVIKLYRSSSDEGWVENLNGINDYTDANKYFC